MFATVLAHTPDCEPRAVIAVAPSLDFDLRTAPLLAFTDIRGNLDVPTEGVGRGRAGRIRLIVGLESGAPPLDLTNLEVVPCLGNAARRFNQLDSYVSRSPQVASQEATRAEPTAEASGALDP
jgi:hypothetical protein